METPEKTTVIPAILEPNGSGFNIEAFSRLQELMTKAVFLVTPIAYFFGFLVSNYYYLGMGIGSIGLVRSEYILAGIVFLLLTGLNFGMIWMLNQYYRRNVSGTSFKKKVIGIAFISLTGLAYTYGLAPSIDKLTLSDISKSIAGDIPVTYFSLYFLLSAVGYWYFGRLTLMAKNPERVRALGIDDPTVTLAVPALAIYFLIVAVIGYATTIFPHSSSLLSGAKAPTGTIYFAKDAQISLKSGREYPIVFRNEKVVYIRDFERDLIVEVKADKVESIEYKPLNPLEKPSKAIVKPTTDSNVGPMPAN